MGFNCLLAFVIGRFRDQLNEAIVRRSITIGKRVFAAFPIPLNNESDRAKEQRLRYISFSVFLKKPYD